MLVAYPRAVAGGTAEQQQQQQAVIFGFGNGSANDQWNQGAALPTFASGLEVVTHEMTHGVVQATAAPEGERQPGVLHEHLTDVFGATIEQ